MKQEVIIIEIDDRVKNILDSTSEHIKKSGELAKISYEKFLAHISDLKKHTKSSNDIVKTYAMVVLGDDYDDDLTYVYNPNTKKISVYDVNKKVQQR